MPTSRLLIKALTFLLTLVLAWVQPVKADLPPGNAIKDPYAILRNALPIDQKDLREIQHRLEETSDAMRGNRWTTLSKAATSSQSILNNRKQQIIQEIPNSEKSKAENLLTGLKETLKELELQAKEENKDKFIAERRKSLSKIGELEALLITNNFPYTIPNEFDNLPRLLGRANVSIKTNKGSMNAVIDGFNAPLTAGAFIDLSLKGFYDGLPISRAEDFYILQSGDPKGPEIGYIDPSTKQERKIPLEIRVPEKKETLYNQTFEDIGLYKSTPVLPFATLGTLGWAHSGSALDDGSSQFFMFLYEPELTPAGRNLIDGRNAAFGYVVDGFDVLENLGVNDQILSIQVIDGADRLKPHA